MTCRSNTMVCNGLQGNGYVGRRKPLVRHEVSYLLKGRTPRRTPEIAGNRRFVPPVPPFRVRSCARIHPHTHEVLGRTVGHTKQPRSFPVSHLFSEVGHERDTMTKPMRQAMPVVAAFIDDLRDAFGKDMIDAQIRIGIKGGQAFHAKEGGQSIGTPLLSVDGIKLSETIVGRMFPDGSFDRRGGRPK